MESNHYISINTLSLEKDHMRMDCALMLGRVHQLKLEGQMACSAHTKSVHPLHMQTDKKVCHTSIQRVRYVA